MCAAAYIRMHTFVDPKPPPHGSTRVILEQVRTAVRMYEVDTGHLPSELRFLVERPTDEHWAGPYLKDVDFKDPWGNPLRYTPSSSNTFEVLSVGPDGAFGTEDDIDHRTPRKNTRPINWGGGI